MPFVSYDPNTPGEFKRIKGRFTKENIVRAKTQSYVEVDHVTFEQVSADPNNYSVQVSDSGIKLVANERSINNFTKAKAIAEDKKASKAVIAGTLEVDGRVYDPNPAFQQNLSNALGIMGIDNKYVTHLWCRLGDKWEFVEHDSEMCAAVAKAFDQRRIQQSKELYQNL